MLIRTDPFRDFDRLAQQFFGSQSPGTWSHPTAMPMDAYRDGDQYVVALDLPGISPDAIDLDVERNVLTVKAERRRSSSPTAWRCRSPSVRSGCFRGSCSWATLWTPSGSRRVTRPAY